MNIDFNVGDEVMLSPTSMFYSSGDHLYKDKKIIFGNPENTKGTIIKGGEMWEISSGHSGEMEEWVYVKWENNMINSYPEYGDDLIPFQNMATILSHLEKNMYKHDPLKVTCPVCKSKPGEICRTGSGKGLWGKPHKTRKKLAKEMENDKQ